MIGQTKYGKNLSTTSDLETIWTFGETFVYVLDGSSQTTVTPGMIVRIKKLINDRIEEIESLLQLKVNAKQKRSLRLEQKEYQRQINLLHEGNISCLVQEKNARLSSEPKESE